MNPIHGREVLRGLRTAIETLIDGVGLLVRGVGFWVAILLPVLYVPLVLIGHAWMVDAVNLSKVLALHAAFLFVGHDYAGGAERRS